MHRLRIPLQSHSKDLIKPSNQTVPELPEEPPATKIFSGYISFRTLVFILSLAISSFIVLLLINKNTNTLTYLRLIILVVSLTYFGFILSCPCPIGAAGIITSALAGGYRININVMVLFVTPLVLTLVVGRVFCGWICPAGALQEFLRLISRKTGVKKDLKVPKELMLLKYLVLILVIALSAFYLQPIFCIFDPFRRIFTLEVHGAISLLLVTLLVAASLLFERPFCKVIYPYGAILSLAERLSILRIRRTKGCRQCELCSRVCPMQSRPGVEGECILCGNCTIKCHQKALVYGLGGTERRKD